MLTFPSVPKREKSQNATLQYSDVSSSRRLLESSAGADFRLPSEPKMPVPLERRSRMLLRSILKVSLCATILVMIVTTASAVAPADQATGNSVQAIHTYLLPDLSLKSALLVPLSPQPPTGFHKTCRCSCGTAKCATDADCGGGEGSCSAFISCCAKPEAASIQGAGESSRQTALPAFKEQCN